MSNDLNCIGFNKNEMRTALVLMLLTLLSNIGYSQSKEGQVKKYALAHLTENNLVASDLDNWKVTDEYSALGNTYIYLTQQLNNVSIFNAVINAAINEEGEVYTFNSSFVMDLTSKGNPSFTKSPLQALNSTLNHLGYSGNSNGIQKSKVNENGAQTFITDLSEDPAEVQKHYLWKNGKLLSVYNVVLYITETGDWWNVRINAETGEFVEKNNWTVFCSFGHDNCSDDHKSPLLLQPDDERSGSRRGSPNSYNVYDLPIESPNHGNRSIVVAPWDTGASPFGWHDVNGVSGAEYTITRGNNVFARDDKDANNAGGYSPDGGSDLDFDFSFDESGQPQDYLDAVVTNLFFWNNALHDVWYFYGFDEQSGNFQENNYSKGGTGSDFVWADAQDGSGTNNANFGTPPDGQNPRMQMFLWASGSSSGVLEVTSPQSIAKKYTVRGAAFNPSLTSTPVTGTLALVDDGTSNGSEGCNNLVNGSAVNGKIAVIDRGNCTFVSKILNAQSAGAIAVIMINNINGNPITMGGTNTGSINIPSVMISKSDGAILKGQIANGISAKLYDSSSVLNSFTDSDLDNGVISHEYGHGISNRLTGGPANANCLRNQEQMGEGWSDFFALVMTHESGDKGEDKRGIGTYVRFQGVNGNGIRPYPYSTNMSINPVTYDYIKTLSVPHGVGSVWCSMLWDMYWDLIDEHGYDSDIYHGTGGNNIAMKLVMEGMKLQPCSPGFIDGRDAILKADENLYGGVNKRIIWEAFARRGLGGNALQGSSGSRSDGLQGFEVPAYLKGLELVKSAPDVINAGETITYTLKVFNRSDRTQYNVVVKDSMSHLSGTIQTPACSNTTLDKNILTITADSIQKGDSIICSFDFITSPDDFSKIIYEDLMEDMDNWEVMNDLGTNEWDTTSIISKVGDISFYVTNPGSQSDQSIVFDYDLKEANPVLSFWHYYNTEANWDGCVIEAKEKLTGWIDLGPYFRVNGYNSTISTNQASTISQRMAFSGNSGGFVRSIADLSFLRRDSIQIRFRFASDGAQGGVGWFLDDFKIMDAKSILNVATVEFTGGSGESSTYTLMEGDFSTSVDEDILENRINIYPNPVTDKFSVTLANLEGESTVNVYNSLGQIVYDTKSSENIHVDVSAFASGLYVVEVINKGRSVKRKLVKQ
jgi:extracellular elastinolytic metalloproteinase